MSRFLYILLICLLVSCEEIFLEEDITERKLQLLAPFDNAVIETQAVNFSWSAVEGATLYQIQIATPNFQAPLEVTTEEVEENYFTEDLNEGRYEWRVKAMNSSFESTYALAGFQVKYRDELSEQGLVLIAPPDEFVSMYQTVDLDWIPEEGAEFYRVQILQEGQLIVEETTPESNLQVDFPEGQSIWKVRAENEEQNTQYSERRIVIDSKSPKVPELLSPADEEELSDAQVSFNWKRVAVVGTTELDSLFIFQDSKLGVLVEKAQVSSNYNITLEKGTYFWYMKAFDAAGNQSGNSELFSFSIK